MFDDNSRTLYLLELKSTKGTSIPYTMIRKNQIDGLDEADNHMLVAGFIFNFREKDNATYFMTIENFIVMQNSTTKKSFNIEDLNNYGALLIQNEKKRTRYHYDLERFVAHTRL